jgi:transglutaminase-like putative cysteine protease
MKPERIMAGLFLLFQLWLAGSLGGFLPLVLLLVVAVLVAMLTAVRWSLPPNLKIGGWIVTAIVCACIAKVNAPETDAEDLLSWRTWAMAVALFCLCFQTCELGEMKHTAQLPRYLVPFGVATVVCLFSQASVNRPALAISSAIMSVYLAAIQFDISSGKVWSLVNQPLSARSLVIYCLLATVAITTAYIDEFFLYNVPRLQNWLETRVQVAAGQTQSIRSYVRNATLSSIAFEKRTDANSQALLVDCEKMPGYLRGAAYDTFDGTNWTRRRIFSEANPTVSTRTIPPLNPSEQPLPPEITLDKGTQLFPINQGAEGPWLKLRVRNDPRRGEMFFSPLEADHMQITSGALVLDSLDVVRGKISTRQPYTYYLGKTETKLELPAEQVARLTRVPDTLEPRLKRLLPRVFTPNTNTTAQRIAAVESYFRTNYEYSLDGFEAPPGTTTFHHFLDAKPAAHCEYFASGAAMLLRMQGVPCRYVTGYAVTVTTWSENTQWIARNRDAHAWVEAFDQEANAWRVVEATPKVNVPKSLRIRNTVLDQETTGTEVTAGATQADSFWDIRRWWIYISAAKLDRWLMTAAVAVLTLGGAWFVGQRWRSRQQVPPLLRERRKLRGMLVQLDRRLQRHQLRRERVETLHQFAQRVRHASVNDPWLQRVADWYLDYAQVVYGRAADLQSLRELALRVP